MTFNLLPDTFLVKLPHSSLYNTVQHWVVLSVFVEPGGQKSRVLANSSGLCKYNLLKKKQMILLPCLTKKASGILCQSRDNFPECFICERQPPCPSPHRFITSWHKPGTIQRKGAFTLKLLNKGKLGNRSCFIVALVTDLSKHNHQQE